MTKPNPLMSRRSFLGAASAASALGAAPVSASPTPQAAEFGMPVRDLDTPALLVDLDALETNLATLQRTVSANGIAARPHAKTHKCPAIARMQLDAGAVGISVAKVSEAEALFDHGIEELLPHHEQRHPLQDPAGDGPPEAVRRVHPGDGHRSERP